MDVVGYYATYGHSARIKMFHCMRADLTGTDCPYELVVVPKEASKGDYHTVSASGIVQVIRRGESVDILKGRRPGARYGRGWFHRS